MPAGRPPRPEYDSEEFRRLWFSMTPLRVIAEKYGVTYGSVHSAAMKRGFPGKLTLRAQHDRS